MKKSKIYTSMALLLSGVFSIGMLLFNQCSFEEPSAPNWDVEFQLPLISKTYTMADIAEDVKELNVRDDTVWVNIEEDIDSEKVGDKLQVDGASKTVTIPSGGSISDSVSIPDDKIILNSATISYGSVLITFENLSTGTLDIQFELEDLINKKGNTLSIDTTISNSILSENINLEDYTLIPHNNNIHFNGSITGGSGNLKITVQIQQLIFSKVSGKLNSVEVNIDSMESELDIPEEFKDFAVEKANLQIAFNSTISFPFDIDITIQALESRNTLPAPIHISESIVPTGTEPDTIYVGDIADFINCQPTKILVYGDAYIGKGQQSHSITENDSISGKVLFNAPLTVSIPSLKSKMEPDTITIDEDTQDFLRENLKRAEFNVKVINKLPIGTNLSIMFSNTYTDTLIYEANNFDFKFDLELKKAPTSSTVPAVVTDTVHSHLNITLDEDKLSHFINNDTLYVGFMFEFLGPDVLTKFRPQDYIEIEAYISALVKTKVPEDEE
ncbi:MAG: hypothetical protein R6V04_14785 [bacterium]